MSCLSCLSHYLTIIITGAMVGPNQAGSAYVLLHHIMGEAAGRKGVWAYIEGSKAKRRGKRAHTQARPSFINIHTQALHTQAFLHQYAGTAFLHQYAGTTLLHQQETD